MTLGPVELLIILAVLVLNVAAIGIPVWAAVDAGRRPDAAWAAAGQNKTLWIVLPLVGIVLCGLGVIAAIVYFAAIRPKVAEAEQASGLQTAG